MRFLYYIPVLLFTVILVGCSDEKNNGDLEEFINEVKSSSQPDIDPIPEYEEFDLFSYSAQALRSPFEQLKKAIEREKILTSTLKPDENRKKEFLEQFDIASFSMVGHISNDDGVWGLVKQGPRVHRVGVGRYLGKNFGIITEILEGEIKLLELVVSRQGLWSERRRRISLMSGDK
ncbi:MAG: pilus assembly protein PilP [Candidatus Endonucleobacter sp. (ex Gigantidas childressi)]|nr:pilus assembly protein PilP [Candidatus Endonucleobacter sp. (ex Gigantidas childressi)]